MKGNHCRCELEAYPETGHGLFNGNGEDRGVHESTIAKMYRFLAWPGCIIE